MITQWPLTDLEFPIQKDCLGSQLPKISKSKSLASHKTLHFDCTKPPVPCA